MPITAKLIFGSAFSFRTGSSVGFFFSSLFPSRSPGKIDNKPAADVAAVADLRNLRRSYLECCIILHLSLSNLGSSGGNPFVTCLLPQLIEPSTANDFGRDPSTLNQRLP